MLHRRPVVLASGVAVAAFVLLAAGCGGGSPETAGVASSGTTTVQYGPGAAAGALAFARCMRAHGAPNWPDPGSNGDFDKRKLVQLGISVSRIRAIEQRSCHYVFESRSEAQTITPAERADYLEAAACMRAHGFPGFPDPAFPNGHLRLDIPSSVDQDTPRFKRAAATCTKLIPAGLPYSSSGGR